MDPEKVINDDELKQLTDGMSDDEAVNFIQNDLLGQGFSLEGMDEQQKETDEDPITHGSNLSKLGKLVEQYKDSIDWALENKDRVPPHLTALAAGIKGAGVGGAWLKEKLEPVEDALWNRPDTSLVKDESQALAGGLNILREQLPTDSAEATASLASLAAPEAGAVTGALNKLPVLGMDVGKAASKVFRLFPNVDRLLKEPALGASRLAEEEAAKKTGMSKITAQRKTVASLNKLGTEAEKVVPTPNTPSDMEAGKTAWESIKRARTAQKEAEQFSSRYGALKEAGKKVPEDVAPELATVVESMSDDIDNVVSQPGDSPLKRTLSFFKKLTGKEEDEAITLLGPSGEPISKAGVAKKVGFNDLTENFRALKNLIKNEVDSSGNMSPFGVKLIELQDATYQQIIKQAEKSGNKELLKTMETLSNDYREFKDTFLPLEQAFKGGEAAPHKMADKILKDPKLIQAYKKAAGEDAFRVLKSKKTEKLLSDISKLDLTDDTLSLVYSPEEIQALGELQHSRMNYGKEFKALGKMEDDFQKEFGGFRRETDKSGASRFKVRPGEPKIGMAGTDFTNYIRRFGVTSGAFILLTVAHYPKLAATLITLGIGPEVAAKIYTSSPAIRKAMMTVASGVKGTTRNEAINKVTTYVSSQKLLKKDNSNESK